ncbi:MAG TPA: isochorismatase family cysteine hydrolase [Syntrophales bacterium]|nr:isochorismatase family cysteine hydrolase [Syntrophales bacterium]HOX94379.1 isochorismatase family cysteine hydrolase [Syntrophales bacterium]HPI57789.1 isochorismatase family cysteine hydrolase [Syntrophales bacterium]HPN24972.1 isochorismatase family cysteine hydrolase [Syntrophales bacterium]HQM29782.1 isochorismatase family cysteine hydrolase [Syntrophales bacterium]
MRPAVIVVDMIKDNVGMHLSGGKSSEFVRIIPNLQRLLHRCRQRNIPVVFANDSFMEGDLLFSGRMKPHAIRGTPGVEVIEELGPEPGDTILEKRRLSAFFKTDLDMTLRLWKIDTIVVAGIATPVCVYMTAMDGFSYDFKVIIVEDCCAAHKPEIHDTFLSAVRTVPLDPLVRIVKLDAFLAEIDKLPRDPGTG